MSFGRYFVDTLGWGYQYVSKPLLFQFDPEFVHNHITQMGEILGKSSIAKKAFKNILVYEDYSLKQHVNGINFKNPVGLSAGFDYDAHLTQILPCIGFGFATVGTVTNLPYLGNKVPRLGRLPKSQSLMVNKGFKSSGATVIASKLKNLSFKIPLGVSIGRTNTNEINTQKKAVEDIVQAFITFESAGVKNSYYELNISCPNLHGDVTFYPLKNLKDLLSEIEKLHLEKPLFIKMPIEKSNKEVLSMMEVITSFNVQGIIIGNLQKNRSDPSLHPQEVAKFPVGNFSGKPTWNRSNELIECVYKKYGKKIAIIGTGGVFSASDAYEKIKKGATLVQLITGLIYKGPQLVSKINRDLPQLLQKDGFNHISEAIGADVQ